MCTFETDHRVLVCDLAVHRVREATSQAFGQAVQFTAIEGSGTRVEAPPTIDAEAFQAVTREAIAAAQQPNASQIPYERVLRGGFPQVLPLRAGCAQRLVKTMRRMGDAHLPQFK